MTLRRQSPRAAHAVQLNAKVTSLSRKEHQMDVFNERTKPPPRRRQFKSANQQRVVVFRRHFFFASPSSLTLVNKPLHDMTSSNHYFITTCSTSKRTLRFSDGYDTNQAQQPQLENPPEPS